MPRCIRAFTARHTCIYRPAYARLLPSGQYEELILNFCEIKVKKQKNNPNFATSEIAILTVMGYRLKIKDEREH